MTLMPWEFSSRSRPFEIAPQTRESTRISLRNSAIPEGWSAGRARSFLSVASAPSFSTMQTVPATSITGAIRFIQTENAVLFTAHFPSRHTFSKGGASSMRIQP